MTTLWWQNAVFYQVYPRSFADGNGDGTGDLIGLRSRLPYLQQLGVQALWLSPFYRSPMIDGGYDVADPCDVDPLFGTLADFDALLADAHELRHQGHRRHRAQPLLRPSTEWFLAALAAGSGQPGTGAVHLPLGRSAASCRRTTGSRSSAVRRGPGPPTAIRTRATATSGTCTCSHREQPDLDWTNPEVPAEFERIMRFWLDRGVDGFRVDVAHGMAKPAGLPDMDLALVNSATARPMPSQADIRWDRDHVHEHHRDFRRVLDSYPGDRMAVGEVWVADDDRLAQYVRGDELNLTFNFELVQARLGR